MQKVALVTGGAAGIGRACCVRLAKDGYAIGVLDLDEKRCADTVKDVEAAGGKALAVGADISNRTQVQAALAKLRAGLGPITILVNNAGTKMQPHYSASKGAIVSLTRSLADALGQYGITVNNIPPGSVMHTIMSEANRDRFPVPIETMMQNMPVRRLGEPEDISNACAWLCDEATSYVTGQTIGVNGGRVVT
jgi:2-hydroxycyclohexanecarboxyl-CoA dehydrogenase